MDEEELKSLGLPTSFVSNEKAQRKRKRKRKQDKNDENLQKSTENHIEETANDNIEIPVSIKKYFDQRHRLFSKYDQGILLDEESWYSVTPEVIAKHIAERCRSDVIIDAFCGAGGNSIQFAFTCEQDIDPHKIELARHNAAIYGVEDRIEFIVGDFMQLSTDLKIFKKAKEITPHIAYFLPRNVNVEQLASLDDSPYEMEKNILNKAVKTVTVYFGELVSEIPQDYLQEQEYEQEE